MNIKKVLVTGGVGFVGSHLVSLLLKNKKDIVVIDLIDPDEKYKSVAYIKGDIGIKSDIERLFKEYGPFETIYHLASAMPDKAFSDDILWRTNVIGTKNLIEIAVKQKVSSFIFTSSNVTYGIPKKFPVTSETPLNPIEIYGESKMKAEEELIKYKNDISIQIIRCPVISGVGRLGLQAILFEFISENKNVYMIGDGTNKYQFVDVDDVADALEKASHVFGFDIYTIGADQIISLYEIYMRIIKFAKSKSRIIKLPEKPAQVILALLNWLHISPLGVYQYSMLGRSYYTDTSKIKKKLGWTPKKTNEDTFIENYIWYKNHKGTFLKVGSHRASSNRSVPKKGIFTLLKLIS